MNLDSKWFLLMKSQTILGYCWVGLRQEHHGQYSLWRDLFGIFSFWDSGSPTSVVNCDKPQQADLHRPASQQNDDRSWCCAVNFLLNRRSWFIQGYSQQPRHSRWWFLVYFPRWCSKVVSCLWFVFLFGRQWGWLLRRGRLSIWVHIVHRYDDWYRFWIFEVCFCHAFTVPVRRGYLKLIFRWCSRHCCSIEIWHLDILRSWFPMEIVDNEVIIYDKQSTLYNWFISLLNHLFLTKFTFLDDLFFIHC